MLSILGGLYFLIILKIEKEICIFQMTLSLQELFSFVIPCAFQTKTTSRVWHTIWQTSLHKKYSLEKPAKAGTPTYPQGIAARLCAYATHVLHDVRKVGV